jgi:hypothetical protein
VTTDAGHISVHLKALLLELFTADQLGHLAAIKREREPYLVARRRLDEASREELADMLVANRVPTVGWWRRQTEKTT